MTGAGAAAGSGVVVLHQEAQVLKQQQAAAAAAAASRPRRASDEVPLDGEVDMSATARKQRRAAKQERRRRREERGFKPKPEPKPKPPVKLAGRGRVKHGKKDGSVQPFYRRKGAHGAWARQVQQQADDRRLQEAAQDVRGVHEELRNRGLTPMVVLQNRLKAGVTGAMTSAKSNVKAKSKLAAAAARARLQTSVQAARNRLTTFNPSDRMLKAVKEKFKKLPASRIKKFLPLRRACGGLCFVAAFACAHVRRCRRFAVVAVVVVVVVVVVVAVVVVVVVFVVVVVGVVGV